MARGRIKDDPADLGISVKVWLIAEFAGVFEFKSCLSRPGC